MYRVTLTREQLMLVANCVEDISRFAAGQVELDHTMGELMEDIRERHDIGEIIKRRQTANGALRVVRDVIHDDLHDGEYVGYNGGGSSRKSRNRLIGNSYQIYREILHRLAVDEGWDNVYSSDTLPSGDMGTIKVERVDDETV